MHDRSKRRFLAQCALAAVLPSLGARAAATAAIIDVCRAQARTFVDAGAAPSLSVAVFRDGVPWWIEAFGWSDRARRVRANHDTRYAIASATKPFTATAVMDLVERGRIELDAPLARQISDVAVPFSDAITVRDALQHRSGVPRHWRNVFRGQGEPAPFDAVIANFAFQTASAGRRYLYSNLNYGLLARAVAHASGEPFDRFVARHVLSPLGLDSAAFLDDEHDTGRMATPYETDGAPIPPYRVDEPGARDLVMTATDLARFGEAHRVGHAALPDALRRRMVDDRKPMGYADAERPFYGLGWMGEEDTPASVFQYGHSGEGPGAAAQLTVVPSAQLVVATIANAQGAPAYALNRGIVDALVPLAAARRVAPPDDVAPDLAAFTGRWSGQVTSRARSVPVRLALAGDAARATVGDADVRLTGLAVDRGVLAAKADARLPFEDLRRWPHQLRWHLERVGDRLEGTIAGYAMRGTSPGTLAHDQCWLSYPVTLSRSRL